MFAMSADINLLARHNKVHYAAENTKLYFDEAKENTYIFLNKLLLMPQLMNGTTSSPIFINTVRHKDN